ncbi:hypothetical protein ACKI1L_37205, partial [Streptomyces scabiei]|uniref:hypothetical protein n=1 Tax=Streptomyces scabiei TaxID=1930 RepID=UPI0038F6DD52
MGTEYDFADTEIKTYGETRKQLKNGVWGYRDTYRNNIEFMRIMKSFKSQVADLDALIAKHKVKNKIIQKCGVIPYTPVFGYNLGKPYRDNGCCQTKMG